MTGVLQGVESARTAQHHHQSVAPFQDAFTLLSTDPATTTAELGRAAGHLGDVLCAQLWIHDATTRSFRQIAWHGVERTNTDPVADGTEPFATAVSVRRSVLMQAPECATSSPRCTWRFAVPAWTDQGLGVGVIDFGGPQPDGPGLARLAAVFSTRIGASIAVHSAAHEARCAARLLKAGGVLAGIVDPDAAARVLLEQAMSIANADTGSVLLPAEGSGSLRIAASKGLPDDVVASTSVREGEGIAGWVLATGKPVTIEDLPARGRQGRRHGVRSSISVPIPDETKAVGVLSVGSRLFPGNSLGPVVDALGSLAEAGSSALVRSQAFVTTRSMYFETLQALVMALETKDPFAHGSTARVVDLTTSIGRALSLTEADAEALRIASLLHDIGMAAAGDTVSVSGRPLSTVEHTLLKMHPMIAADILRQAPTLERVVPIVYHHHERYDGTGYMTGLAGDRIPIGARILAVADSYVAMTSDRPYRRAFSAEEALAELQRHAGSQFDPEVVAAFVSLHPETTTAARRRPSGESVVQAD